MDIGRNKLLPPRLGGLSLIPIHGSPWTDVPFAFLAINTRVTASKKLHHSSTRMLPASSARVQMHPTSSITAKHSRASWPHIRGIYMEIIWFKPQPQSLSKCCGQSRSLATTVSHLRHQRRWREQGGGPRVGRMTTCTLVHMQRRTRTPKPARAPRCELSFLITHTLSRSFARSLSLFLSLSLSLSLSLTLSRLTPLSSSLCSASLPPLIHSSSTLLHASVMLPRTHMHTWTCRCRRAHQDNPNTTNTCSGTYVYMLKAGVTAHTRRPFEAPIF